jgi:hypothetical protein
LTTLYPFYRVLNITENSHFRNIVCRCGPSFSYSGSPRPRKSPSLSRASPSLSRASPSLSRASPPRDRPGPSSGLELMARAGSGKKARKKPGWPGSRANTNVYGAFVFTNQKRNYTCNIQSKYFTLLKKAFVFINMTCFENWRP